LPIGEESGTSICKPIFGIGGNVYKHCTVNEDDEKGVEDVIITMAPTGPPVPNTDNNGDYTITPLLPGDAFTITPSKNTIHDDGVTAFDMLLIRSHILKRAPLSSPYKKIAADVNNSLEITSYDVVLISKVVLEIEDFQIVPSWKFVHPDYVFPPPSTPWFPEYAFPQFPLSVHSKQIGNLGAIAEDGDFIAVKMGDVSCDADGEEDPLPPCQEEVKILAEDKALQENDVFTWALRTENFDNIEAYQFALRFDATKLQYQNIQQGDLNRATKPENFNLTTTNTGLIRTLWLYNDASNPAFTVTDTSLADYASLFLIQFKALQDIPALSDVINLSADDLPGGAWSDGEDCTRNVVMQFMPEGFADNRSGEQKDSENLSNKVRVHPNPTTGVLSFEITTDIAAENTIQIYSTTGQQVLRQSVYLEKGNNTVSMEDISNWQDGLYFYTITDASGLLRSGKFVKN
jgi:Secretion system C-terminal sorting domain/Cohesin domain/Dockerin type I domain